MATDLRGRLSGTADHLGPLIMNTAEDFTSGPGLMQLWLGLLLGPIVVLTQLEANYALTLWACNEHEWVLHVVSALALLMTLFAAVISIRCWRSLGSSWQMETGGALPRSRFMSALGILISLLMSLVALAQWIAVFAFNPCER
jgi:hypothetical protein